MDSPYESRLLEAIASARDDISAALVRAELAGYWARLGRFDEADQAIREVRTSFGDGRSGRVTIMVMCAEAQVLYFRRMHPAARDRLARGQLLSAAGGDRSLNALTSAWLAHVDFNLNSYQDMARSISNCLGSIQPEDIAAKCRVALTLADAFLTTGDVEGARPWYARAHQLTVQLGDHAAMAALTMNRAVLGVFNARLRDADSQAEPVDVSRLAAEVRSAVNYESAANLRSLKALLDNAAISIMLLEGRHDQAVGAIEALLPSSPVVNPVDSTALLRCDLALCYASLGRFEEASSAVEDESLLTGIQRCTADDRFLGYSMLRRACERLTRVEAATNFANLAAHAKGEHLEQIRTLAAVLTPFRSVGVLDHNSTPA